MKWSLITSDTNKFTHEDLRNEFHNGRIIKFYISVSTMYGQCDNQYFFDQLSQYLEKNYQDFDRFLTSRSIDLFKFFNNFEDNDLKTKLLAHYEMIRKSKNQRHGSNNLFQ